MVLRKANSITKENFKELTQFLKSTNFSKAILTSIAITIPLLLGIRYGQIEIGLALSFGAFWASPSDVNGSYHDKCIGILFSAALAMIISFIGGYLAIQIWLLLPVLGTITFAIAYISVFGFRASLISFSGLLALVLSFAHQPGGLLSYEYALLIGLGGLWYLLLVTIWYRINPKAQTEEMLSQTFMLTAQFLETRGKLVGPQPDRQQLSSKLYELQSVLIQNHQTLREVLLQSRKHSGKSNYEDKRLLVFVLLVEMLETALANPVNYTKMDAFFSRHPEFVKSFQALIFEMASELKSISEIVHNSKKFSVNNALTHYFDQTKQQIKDLQNMNHGMDFDGYLMLQNLFDYQEKQFDKLKRIKWLLGNKGTADLELIDRDVFKRFITHEEYEPKILIQNFSFKSVIFKHALRLAVTVMIGYALGSFFDFQNPYWILLTIIVIMRPSYGLTKSRTKDRILGTLIGAALAYGMIFLVHNPMVYGALAIISLVIAIAMVQKNYRASATFITLCVVFSYAIIQPDILTVIQFRIWDTIVGAALSFFSMLWLWPTWSFSDIKEPIEKSVRANKDFLNHIAMYYEDKGRANTNFKIARKDAFLETSNLSSAFQSMAQEPKSQQKNSDKIYEFVVLNHNFLSALASLSTYIQQNTTTQASTTFKLAIGKIEENLNQVINGLSGTKPSEVPLEAPTNRSFKELLSDIHPGKLVLPETDSTFKRNEQEAHLVIEQLQWLHAISEDMRRLTASLG